ncbi:type VI secretion system-associated FHA domain protein TagH [Mesorhizobium sp. BR1-1-16]|uniref:type VI secretion system-associated FHA domain protein TagH n=1 Tax=Mesorhizobium sp. BR1-1-16 TaxID=2876653 RepID=UPI001CCE6F04|nr:type VI secretion system-associated FHA domain protein TagH [Mesorhizobium sp. BR1-1-16]MBZ9936343.1 type VI secretion system-associated FHA domain protein TagH [Mesorhizobium sp. BR1-1-16]
MSLFLTLEQGPRSQSVRQARLDRGELTIGRDAQANWRIDDPDMFVSRVHCLVEARPEGYIVTDRSSGGLFIDNADSPLGRGNSARLVNGMRLRLGDYVLLVEVQPEQVAPVSQPRSLPPASPMPSLGPASFGGDDFFAIKAGPEPAQPRPGNLPDPFDPEKPGPRFAEESAVPRSAAFDDPFSLDPVATPAVNRDQPRSPDFNFASDSFAQPPSRSAPEEQQRAGSGGEVGFSPARSAQSGGAVSGLPNVGRAPWELPLPDEPQPPEPAVPPLVERGARMPERGGLAQKSRPAVQPLADEGDLLAAFMRGAGMKEDIPAGRTTTADMEKLGREYRLMMEGLMQLLRKRAEEKANARLGQTVVGASEVNPLKFLPTVDDAMATIFAARSPGFLSGEAAIGDAVKDLAQHHIRAWRGVQAALRRMIDRFDPVAIEAELKVNSSLGSLLPGGRGTRLWDIYQRRYREIAESAEQRFLGEIGSDFRDAYEED